MTSLARSLSIRAKLKLITLSVSGIALLVACGAFILYDYYSVRDHLVEQLGVTAGILGSNCTAAITFDDPLAAEESLSSLRENPYIQSAVVFGADNLPFAGYEKPGTAAGSPTSPLSEETSFEFRPEELIVARPIELDGQRIGSIQLHSDLRRLHDRLERYLGIVALVLLFSLLVAFGMTARLHRLISEPIGRLADAAWNVSANRNYSLRVDKQTDDEVGLLVDGFNDMLAQIQIRDRELEQHRGHLEEQVSKRTGELTHLNKELAHSRDSAEAATRSKSMFLANVSHEIRTPVNGIVGMAKLMQHTDLSPQQHTWLTSLSDSAESLLTVINDILDFSKIEAGKLTLDPECFRLRECLDRALSTLAIAAADKGVELASHTLRDVPDRLIGDPGRLRQILVNLVGNAVKFTGEGEIEVRVELSSLASESAELHFSVRDTGIGIALEQQELVFRSFEQADGSATRIHGGTGLGLSIASQLVSLMHGGLWLESEPGRGSTFHFTARFGRELEDRDDGWQQPPQELVGQRALIIEPSQMVRQVLVDILEQWQMIPRAVAEGPEALEEIELASQEDRPYSVILLEASMPQMDGYEMTGWIRERLDPSVVVILLTSPSRREEHHDGPRIDSVISKPVRAAQLQAALLSAIQWRNRGVLCSTTPREEKPGQTVVSRRVLLAEDNPVNQEFAVVVLQRRGHDVTVVDDGMAALRAMEDKEYDVVLLDLSMPRMGGLQVAVRVREKEAGTNRHSWLVAMTAHALKGDRERCLGAGMDDYLAKPVTETDLYRTVERVGPGTEETPVCGNGVLLEGFDTDPAGERKVLQVFLERSPVLLDALGQAVESGDPKALSSAAHRLAGTLALFHSKSAYSTTRALESLARNESLSGATDLWTGLCREVESIREQASARLDG